MLCDIGVCDDSVLELKFDPKPKEPTAAPSKRPAPDADTAAEDVGRT